MTLFLVPFVVRRAFVAVAIFAQRQMLSNVSGICFVIVSLLAFQHEAFAQFNQQGRKLVGRPIGTYQGWGEALSADGNTAIIGGGSDRFPSGLAYVFTRQGRLWSQQGPALHASGAIGNNSNYGVITSAALSADGNTAIVGSGYADAGKGAVWIFARSGGVWTQQGRKLVPRIRSNATATYFAAVGGLSADGTTAVLGCGDYAAGIGGACIFTRNVNGAWRQQGYIETPYQGQVAISGDGRTIVVGGPGDDSNVGSARVFTRTGRVWTQQGGALVGSGYQGQPQQGGSLAISHDGNTIIIGGPLDSNNIGAAWIFVRHRGVWTQQGNKLVGSGWGEIVYENEGDSVALSGDGNIALVGGDSDNRFMGAVWVFKRSGNVWSQEGAKLVGQGATGNGLVMQGYHIAISADGTTALVGGFGDNNYVGATWVFVRPPTAQEAQR